MIDVKKIRLKYVTDKNGKKTEVIMKVKYFEELLEDLHDIAIVAERRNEDRIPHEDIINKLQIKL